MNDENYAEHLVELRKCVQQISDACRRGDWADASMIHAKIGWHNLRLLDYIEENRVATRNH